MNPKVKRPYAMKFNILAGPTGDFNYMAVDK